MLGCSRLFPTPPPSFIDLLFGTKHFSIFLFRPFYFALSLSSSLSLLACGIGLVSVAKALETAVAVPPRTFACSAFWPAPSTFFLTLLVPRPTI